MRILQTPAALRPAPIPYPNHSVGPTVETYAYQWFTKNQQKIDTELIYLPIFWQSTYWADRKAKRSHDVGAVEANQEFLNTKLDPAKRYWTCSMADEGAYEQLPTNLIMFSGGGVGHIAIPLLCDDHTPIHRDRTILASFIGTVETAGPAINRMLEPLTPRPLRSSWHKDGAGATVRRAMQAAFAGRSDCVIQTSMQGAAGRNRFIELACSSKFALSPRGYGQTSFRMYEAMKLGAIPVYIYDDCWLPYGDAIDWNKLGVLCHVENVQALPAKLAAITEQRLKAYRQYAADVLPDYFTLDGTCKQIARYITSIG